MNTLVIKTDHKWKPFKYSNEVPASVLNNQFDYQNRDEVCDGFILYKKCWYHLDTFVVLGNKNNDSSFGDNWQGHHGESAFSGVLIEVSRDGESYRIASYYC